MYDESMAVKVSKQNVYAFIDSQNLNISIQKMGWKIDWRKFRKFLAVKYNVSKAYLFIGYMVENENLYEYMHDLGYLVVLKPTVDIKLNTEEAVDSNLENVLSVVDTPDQKSTIKGNIDADLVLYAMKEFNNYDQAVIVSGDGDFYGLIEYLMNQNKLKALMAPNWMYSSLLKPFEKFIVRLDLERKSLAYKDNLRRHFKRSSK